MVSAKRALERIRLADRQLNAAYYPKVYRLRALVAGDPDAAKGVGYIPGNNADPGASDSRANNKWRPDIQVSRFTEGRDNTMQNILIGLAHKTCFNFPRYDFSRIRPSQQVVMAQYLKVRMGPKIKGGCNAVDHGKIALLDYLEGGMGTIYLPVDGHGKPGWRWADTLDFKWDQQARLPCDMTWGSITVNMPLSYWMSIPDFAKAPVLQKYASSQPRRDNGEFGAKTDDRPTELEFYYNESEDGDPGAYKVFLKTGDSTWEDDPVFEEENPHDIDAFGEKRWFLPFECAFFAALPSVRLPIGVAEKMLPSQIAVWRAQKRILAVIDFGKTFFKVKKGSLTTKTIEEFLRAYEGGVVEYDAKFGPDCISREQAVEIDSTTLEEMQRHSQNMQIQGGMSNYSFGAPVGKPKFAREVSAMVGQGELIPGTVSQANARLWEAASIKFLANGKKWDTASFSCRIDDQKMDFGKGKQLGPIADYIDPGAELSISEDQMNFMPRQQRIAEAKDDLATALMLAQAGFPAGVERAARRYYEAMGVDDIEARLKRPEPVAAPMPGAPGPGAPMTSAMQGEAATQ